MTADRNARIAAALPPALADLAVTWVPRGTLARPDPATARGVLWVAGGDAFHFEIPGVAGYCLTGGQTLQVESQGGSGEEVLRYLLTTPVAAAFLQRGVPVLHAAVALRDGRAVVIAGDSATGKSVLLAELVLAGWHVIADDLAAIGRADGGSIVVMPTDPTVRLYPDAAARLGVGTGSLPTGAAVPADPAPVEAVWILRTRNEADVRVETLHGMAAFAALVDLAYNTRIAAALMERSAYLDVVGSLVGSAVPISVLTRPLGRWTGPELAATVIRGG